MFGIEEENGPAEYVLTQLAAKLKCSAYQLLPNDRWDTELALPCDSLFLDEGLGDILIYIVIPKAIHRELTPDEEELLNTGWTLSDFVMIIHHIANGDPLPKEEDSEDEYVE